MKELGSEEDLDDVVVEEEEALQAEKTRWMAIVVSIWISHIVSTRSTETCEWCGISRMR